jgi:hypothetical protein
MDLKTKIIEFLRNNGYTSVFEQARIGHMILLVAKDHTDLDNYSNKILLYRTLCELQKEGIVVNEGVPVGDEDSRMKASSWYLK